MGRFVEDHCLCLPRKLLQSVPALFFVHWEKSFKAKPCGFLSGQCQRCYTGARTWDCGYCNPGLMAHLYQLFSGVRDPRHPRIGNKRNILSFRKLFYQTSSFFIFIVLMITGHGGMNVKVVQQPDAVPCILCSDQIRFLKNPDRPESHIFQISDRRCTQPEGSCLSCHLIWTFLPCAPVLPALLIPYLPNGACCSFPFSGGDETSVPPPGIPGFLFLHYPALQ